MTMKKGNTTVPQSKAKTAYALLSEIRALALEEPKRMRMSSWGGSIGNAKGYSPSTRPACSTVGCIGGWVDILKGHKVPAERVLGISSHQADELFFGPLCGDIARGTLAHAKRVAALITKFQKKHRAQLLAKKV